MFLPTQLDPVDQFDPYSCHFLLVVTVISGDSGYYKWSLCVYAVLFVENTEIPEITSGRMCFCPAEEVVEIPAGFLRPASHMSSYNNTTPQLLEQAAETFRVRNATYGNNYLQVSEIMKVLWPDGFPSELVFQPEWHLFELLIVKLTRFANGNLTHIDSIHDTVVYAAMIEDIITPEDQEKE